MPPEKEQFQPNTEETNNAYFGHLASESDNASVEWGQDMGSSSPDEDDSQDRDSQREYKEPEKKEEPVKDPEWKTGYTRLEQNMNQMSERMNQVANMLQRQYKEQEIFAEPAAPPTYAATRVATDADLATYQYQMQQELAQLKAEQKRLIQDRTERQSSIAQQSKDRYEDAITKITEDFKAKGYPDLTEVVPRDFMDHVFNTVTQQGNHGVKWDEVIRGEYNMKLAPKLLAERNNEVSKKRQEKDTRRTQAGKIPPFGGNYQKPVQVRNRDVRDSGYVRTEKDVINALGSLGWR